MCVCACVSEREKGGQDPPNNAWSHHNPLSSNSSSFQGPGHPLLYTTDKLSGPRLELWLAIWDSTFSAQVLCYGVSPTLFIFHHNPKPTSCLHPYSLFLSTWIDTSREQRFICRISWCMPYA